MEFFTELVNAATLGKAEHEISDLKATLAKAEHEISDLKAALAKEEEKSIKIYTLYGEHLYTLYGEQKRPPGGQDQSV